jgi:hypothetical protein
MVARDEAPTKIPPPPSTPPPGALFVVMVFPLIVGAELLKTMMPPPMNASFELKVLPSMWGEEPQST